MARSIPEVLAATSDKSHLHLCCSRHLRTLSLPSSDRDCHVTPSCNRGIGLCSQFVAWLVAGRWSLVGWAVALAMALRTNSPYAYPGYYQQGSAAIGKSVSNSIGAERQLHPAPVAPATPEGDVDRVGESVQPGDMRRFDDGWARYDSSHRWIYIPEDGMPG